MFEVVLCERLVLGEERVGVLYMWSRIEKPSHCEHCLDIPLSKYLLLINLKQENQENKYFMKVNKNHLEQVLGYRSCFLDHVVTE